MARFRKNDEVAFANRCQPGQPPFTVEKVNVDLFGARYKVHDKWWTEQNLIPYKEWKRKA